MAISFPSNPGLDEVYTYNGTKYVWDGVKWISGGSTAFLVSGEVNPVYFPNQAAFPDATANHGAVAHSHADGAMYFAHGGTWNKLANSSEIPAVNNVDMEVLPELP